MLTVKPLRCINTLWLGVYVRYTPWNVLDIPQQNPLKYGFSGIENYFYPTEAILQRVLLGYI